MTRDLGDARYATEYWLAVGEHGFSEATLVEFPPTFYSLRYSAAGTTRWGVPPPLSGTATALVMVSYVQTTNAVPLLIAAQLTSINATGTRTLAVGADQSLTTAAGTNSIAVTNRVFGSPGTVFNAIGHRSNTNSTYFLLGMKVWWEQ
jgi:hypothetical protein